MASSTSITTYRVHEGQNSSGRGVLIHLGRSQREVTAIAVMALKTAETLGVILKKYESEKDDLSKKILLEGSKLTAFVLENHTQPVDAFLKEIIERVDSLKKILHNPFGTPSSLFTDPWLINSIDVWDKSNLDDFLKCREVQPAYLQKEIVAAPHAFAKAVVDWIKYLPTEKKDSNIGLHQALVSQIATHESLSMEEIWQRNGRCREYEYRIAQAEKLRELKTENKELESMVLYLEKFNQEEFERFENDLARQEQTYKETTAEFARCLGSMQEQQSKTKELFQKTNVEKDAMLKKTQDTVKELAAKARELESRLASAETQLYSAHAQLGHLQNELNNAGGDCSIM